MNLVLIAYMLLLPLTFINYAVVAHKSKSKGYFRATAVNIDRFGNREFRALFNKVLIKENGYKFGDIRETISSVLGKNQRDNTLTITGKALVWVLDLIDKNHCEKSIEDLPILI
mgnify:CR=1 FL=1